MRGKAGHEMLLERGRETRRASEEVARQLGTLNPIGLPNHSTAPNYNSLSYSHARHRRAVVNQPPSASGTLTRVGS